MRLRDLAWIVELAELGQVTDAAASLRTNQPTLSRTLARVEDELGARVFERTAHGVRPTPIGETVLAAARELTARYDRLLDELGTALDPETGVVRLAFLDSIATSLVPRLLRAFHADAPAVRVLLSQEPAHHIVRDLDSAAVDLAITSARPAGLGWHPLQEERLVLVVPAHHRLRDRRRVRLSELEGDELITTPQGFGYRALVDGLLREAGTVLPISFESQELPTIEGLVAAGLGVGILPQPFAGVSGTIGIPIASSAARRTIGLAWRTDRPLSPPAQRFRDFVAAADVPT